MTDLKFYSLTLVGFIVALGVVLPKRAPEIITPEGQAKIAAYKAEEDNYYKVQARCGPDASGSSCDKTLNDLATLEVKHARWTIARNKKFGETYDVEAQWIVAHGD
jgi:hypothetical protein